MNIYDTNESVELYDNRGIEMARKCIRRAKRECAFRYLILLLLFALGMVDKILFPQIEIKLSRDVYKRQHIDSSKTATNCCYNVNFLLNFIFVVCLGEILRESNKKRISM